LWVAHPVSPGNRHTVPGSRTRNNDHPQAERKEESRPAQLEYGGPAELTRHAECARADAIILIVTQPDRADITGLLQAWSRGDEGALEKLTPLVYAQLRVQARRYLRKERSGVTLESTGLVHELYLRLTRSEHVDWQDRAHFFALCAQLMRRILVDAARARRASKRGGAAERIEHASVDLDQVAASDTSARSLCALDDALEELRRIDPRRVQVVEMRFFGGLTVEETASVLQVSPQTVMRDWRLARAWLARELRAG
jgi:RNA polymerase sigma factor (TIGR02999 family)